MYRLRYTAQARVDLDRLYPFLADHDIAAARSAPAANDRASTILVEFLFAGRKADPHTPFLRELIIPFGNAGYVTLFEIDDQDSVAVLAVRHQREDDYH